MNKPIQYPYQEVMEGICFAKLTLLLLLAASGVHNSASQNFQTFLKTSNYANFEDRTKEYPDIPQHIRNSLTAIQKLWTENLHSSQLTSECNNSVEYITADATRLLPLLDATGKPAAGILEGNTLLAAAYDECFNYNYTAYCYIGPVFIRNLYTIQWRVGLCVPKYCTGTDVAGRLNSTEIFLVPNSSTTLCTNSKTPVYSTGAKVMIAVSSIFVVLVLIGTFVDTLLSKINIKNRKRLESINSNLEGSTTSESTLLFHSRKVEKCCQVSPQDFITAFSLFKTVPTLLATKQGPSVITSLNGIRVISMFWVILGHTFVFVLQAVDNTLQFLPVARRFSFQAVGNAYFSVDSFFFLSGVLVAYLTLREMKKRNGRFPFLHYYVHRFLRITPTYAFVLFFATYLTIHLSYGPSISIVDPFGPACKKYWWTNLIYINNLHPWALNDECMGWAWYLANDMQFYVIAPLILISAYHVLPASLIITGAFLLSGFTLDALFTGLFDFQASMFASIAYNWVPKPNITEAYTDAIYTKPWDRISPYIVGLALGYILYLKAKFDFNKVVNFIFYGSLWVVAAVVGFWLVYGLYFTWHGHIPHTFENIVYITFGRYLWASSLALIVFACHNGYGWFINSFLSMKLWTPLARMTFNAYLIHPVVMVVVYGQLQTLIHYTDITLAVYCVAFVVLSYAAAGVICLAVELPLGNVEMLIFKLFGSKGRESQRQDTIKTIED